jgi:predicted MFS family arabinose efflux permease
MSSAPALMPAERRVLLLLAAVQFVNIVDFMMVMPLGPDFSAELGIPNAQLGLVGGSYTAAASIAGLAGATFLDRFDRRKALAVTLARCNITRASYDTRSRRGWLRRNGHYSDH